MISLVKDSAKQEAFKQTFNTEDRIVNGDPMSWENARFSSMPVSATVTLLTKIQADLRNTESEVVSYLKNQVDASDFRVNKITAEVIADASYITRGGTYKARIILAAVDSTKRPKITLNGEVLDGEVYEKACNSVGQFDIAGTIDLPRGDGSIQTYDFSSSYIVGEPTAIISADMMNVFYAGIENPISVSVPGVPSQNIMVSVSNGRLTRTAKGWSVRPTKAGTDCKISVSTKGDNGKVQNIGAKPFRVKLLPPPVAYIEYTSDGNPAKYKGSRPISKGALISAKGIKAELDDADLDVRYQVLGFDLNFFDSMGNAIVKASSSGRFTGEQQEIMRKMSKGKKFFISRVRAKGPDGVEKILPPIEVIVN
jgi:gliding motility-associated protein GldM